MYDYIEGRKRIEEILREQIEINEKDNVPQPKSFTFSNAYYGWVTAIFVDIRNSTTLFQDENRVKVAKIIKSFTSEIIEILKDSDLLREIGIRGDCVYAIYTSPKEKDEYNIFDKTVTINTFMKMLNSLFNKYNLPKIDVGIGIATDMELIVKAGRENSGINNLVWIGKAVTTASNLSGLGNKNNISSIVLSNLTYNYIEKKYTDEQKKWFTKITCDDEIYYHCNIVFTNFDNWIKNNF